MPLNVYRTFSSEPFIGNFAANIEKFVDVLSNLSAELTCGVRRHQMSTYRTISSEPTFRKFTAKFEKFVDVVSNISAELTCGEMLVFCGAVCCSVSQFVAVCCSVL